MKKLNKITALILVLCICFMQTSLAQTLYYLEGTDKNEVGKYLEAVLLNRGYGLVKKNPYYAISKNYSEEYAIIVLEQNASDLYYYYDSNAGNRINKDMLKYFDSKDINYHKLSSESLINNFNRVAQNAMLTGSSPNNDKYVFDDEEEVMQPKTQQSGSTNSIKGYVGKIAAGESFNAYLQTAISTANATKGDQVIAVLTNNWVYNNRVIAEQGSRVIGVVTQANHATYGTRNGSVQISFNELQTVSGKTYKIQTEKIDFKVDSDGKAKHIATKVATGAAVGLLSALLFSALSSGDKHYGKSSAIGAGIGAGLGLLTVAGEQGVDAEIPAYTEITLTLSQPMNVSFNY